MKTKLPTTVIGSFPKPDYLPIRDWFDSARDNGTMNAPSVTRNYSQYSTSDEDEALFVRAAEEVIALQVEAGIDVPTDGEVRRENYIHYHCRHVSGFDFADLEHRVLRDGAYETDLPAIRGKVRHEMAPYSVHDFRASQRVSSRDVKFTMPGPLTIMDTTADCFYEDRPRLAADLAATVNKEILALADAGCKIIQVDEPLFARQVDDAMSFGLEGLDRCFHKVPAHVTRAVHICCGYPDYLDDEDYKKADPSSYHALAGAMDDLDFHQVSIEDAHCCNDLELLELFSQKSVIFGSVAVARSRVETIDEVIERLGLALMHIDRDRLVVAPDCGLGMLTRDLAVAKLKVMCAAAAEI
ncbi:cobalamin-independent methionine synthase II family protein [Alphaproteobacteria bacterium]|jgi:5-methyltetrahydropteroyltriglutamate--homocysteine methyltransferase|nr:cobalamin-independent methionine synthase II family protein [Alphaproteobacteria bacterium]NCF48843.1 5-methyltetrahydropteroyltriglutamate--homocysteine methyltransferase [Bacteroidota bacterium]